MERPKLNYCYGDQDPVYVHTYAAYKKGEIYILSGGNHTKTIVGIIMEDTDGTKPALVATSGVWETNMGLGDICGYAIGYNAETGKFTNGNNEDLTNIWIGVGVCSVTPGQSAVKINAGDYFYA